MTTRIVETATYDVTHDAKEGKTQTLWFHTETVDPDPHVIAEWLRDAERSRPATPKHMPAPGT